MIRVNLIRDRAERPATPAERLAPVLFLLLLVAYVFTLVLASALRVRAGRSVTILERRLSEEQRLAQDIGAHAGGYTSADLYSIEIVRQMVALYSEKWNWALKLAALQQCLPGGVAISSFEGDVELRLWIRAYAVDVDGLGLARLEELMRNLQQSDTFMAGLTEVKLRTVGGPSKTEEPGRLYFWLECPIRS